MAEESDNITSNDKRSPMWAYPWAYKESFCLSFSFIFCGFFLQYIKQGAGPEIPKYPGNLALLCSFTVILILAHIFGRQHKFLAFLSSVPATISALGGTLFLVFIMGFVLQGEASSSELVNRLGFNAITSSWAFAFSLIYLQTILGLTILKRLTPFNFKNFSFFINHIGLYMAIMTGAFGSADIEKLRMNTFKDEIVTVAQNDAGVQKEVPLAIKLDKFDIEFYHPKLQLLDNISGKVVYDDKRIMPELEEGMILEMAGWELEVLKFIEFSAPLGKHYYSVNEKGTTPSALLRAKHEDGRVVEGWFTCGSYRFPYKALKLDDNHSIIMTIPEAKAFRSWISCLNPDGDQTSGLLEVNKPILFSGWEIYQVGFDERFGRDSKLSVLEITRDPWLPWIYTSIFTMIFGALLLFFDVKIMHGGRGE